MNTQVHTQHAQTSHLAVACATALIANHKMFADALKMAATPPADAVIPAGYVEPEGIDWKTTFEQLEKARDHAMRSLSALHVAAVENRAAVPADASQATAQHALACLESVLVLHDPLHSAVRKCAIMGGGSTRPSIWANLTFRIDEMRDQAKGSIESVRISARQEAAQAEAKAEVFGEGEHEFQAMVTLQTTAHRFIHVRAQDADAARGVALEMAREQQGAHFVLNEGNHVALDDLHVNAVYDNNGNEVWNDDPDFWNVGKCSDAPTM